MEYSARYDSPIGVLTLNSDGTSLTGLWMLDSPGGTMPDDSLAVFARTRRWLDAYFRGENPLINALPLSPYGTPFQTLIWDILLTIPFGETRTYGDIAKEAAKIMGKARMSSQAVGGAVSRNPISIIIPCHRVVGANHALTGYAGGLDKKLWLLRHEGWTY